MLTLKFFSSRGIIPFSSRQVYSAYAPQPIHVAAKIWSPFFYRFTFLPTPSISPAVISRKVSRFCPDMSCEHLAPIISTIASVGSSKNLVAFVKACDSCADGFNVSSKLHSWYPFGSGETSEQSSKKRLTLSKDDV